MLREAYSPEAFRTLGHQLIDQLADYLADANSAGNMPVLPKPQPEAEQLFWAKHWESNSSPNLTELWATILTRSHHLHHPHYVGHQVSVPAVAPVLSSLLTALLNNGMAVYEMGPVSSALEDLIMSKLGQEIGLGPHCGGIMTSGGTLSNLTALLAARSQVAKADVWQEGTQASYCVLVSEQAHYCVDRAVKIMGWGKEGIIKVPVDTHYRIRVDLLASYIQQAQAAGKEVIALVGSACSTSTGSYDDLEAMAAIAQQHKLWFHVDGAHGAVASFSPTYSHLVKGIEQADSITLDFHKMMMVPALATGLFFKNIQHSYQTFSQQAEYLWAAQEEAEWYNIGKRSFECTKRMISVQVYSLLHAYGLETVAEFVDQVYNLARSFADQIQAHADFELAIHPQANIVCFRFTHHALDQDQLNPLNQHIRAQALEEEAFYLVQTQLRGQTYLRTTLMHPHTTEGQLAQLLDRLSQMGHQYIATSGISPTASAL